MKPNQVPAVALRSTGLGLAAVLGMSLAACGGAVAGPQAQPTPAGASVTTSWGVINEPALPVKVCASLPAHLTPVQGSIDSADETGHDSQPDTGRIQDAINACPAGQAVALVNGVNGASGFLSAPLRMKSGVVLWLDRGVTLFASRNPLDFDNGGGACGTATPTNLRSCKPFILADGTRHSGIVGDGVIDGRGGSLLTAGPNAGRRSWWDVAYQNKTEGLSQQNPILLRVDGGSDFTLYRVAIINAPNFHVLLSGTSDVIAWGIKILSPSAVYTRPGYACPAHSTPDVVTPASCFTPETVKNTDGFDPAQSSRVLLAYSYISGGDDNVAVKSHGKTGSSQLAFLHNHFYYGHGMSIGSETDAGLSDMEVTDLSVDGFDSPGSTGLRIKSDASRGGRVDNVRYRQICLRNVRYPLAFDSYYRDVNAGQRYPSFTNIQVSGLRSLGSARYGGGLLSFAGYRANGAHNPLTIWLDNVVFDGSQPGIAPGRNGSPDALLTATHAVLGPGAVSIAPLLTPSQANDVTVSGQAGASQAIDCSRAFVPFNSMLSNAPGI